MTHETSPRPPRRARRAAGGCSRRRSAIEGPRTRRGGVPPSPDPAPSPRPSPAPAPSPPRP
ncbi:MAG: hypothetical protein EON91_14060 [Brevundimonas sp.]|nr:MAG: hypothetical protein EON91_14060 [Brevundimonas sp.]